MIQPNVFVYFISRISSMFLIHWVEPKLCRDCEWFFFFHFAFKHVCVIFVFLCTSIKRKKSFTILHPQSQPHSLTLSKSRTFKNSCFRYFIHKVCIACVSLGLNITLFSVFRIGYQFVEFKINFARQCLICEPRSPPTTGIVSHRLTAKFTLHVN